jgi:hypothetical protein
MVSLSELVRGKDPTRARVGLLVIVCVRVREAEVASGTLSVSK